MTDDLMQVGVGGIFAILLIKEFSSLFKYFLDKKQGGGDNDKSHSGNDNVTRMDPLCLECRRKIEETHTMTNEISGRKEKVESIHAWVRELHEMHNHKDSDGVYVWYVKRSLEEAMDKLAEAVNKQTILLEKFFDQYARNEEERRRTTK